VAAPHATAPRLHESARRGRNWGQAPRIAALLRSPSLRAAAVYAVGGGGFAVGNLLLARVLAPAQFGTLSLALSLLNLSVPLAPLGIDGTVNRRRVDPGPRLAWRAAATAALVGLVTAAVAAGVYHVPPSVSALLFLAVTAGGVSTTAAAKFQSLRRFPIALAIAQADNTVLLLAGLAALALGRVEVAWVLAALVAGYVTAGALGWTALVRRHRVPPALDERLRWGESLSYVGVKGSAYILLQLERLAIGRVMTLHDLATFGVLAAITTSPFRMLRLGIGYTLLPRVRAAATPAARWRVVRGELAASVAVMAAGGVAVWLLTPVVLAWAVDGKYVLTGPLVVAAVLTGVLKAVSAFPAAIVAALGEGRELAALSVFGWGSIVVSFAGVVAGARWGLTGAVYGAGAGWLLQTVVGAALGARALRAHREPRPAPPASPALADDV
jgi:hypothetical protein